MSQCTGETTSEDMGRGRINVGRVESGFSEFVSGELNSLKGDIDDESGRVGDEEGAETFVSVDAGKGGGDGRRMGAVDL